MKQLSNKDLEAVSGGASEHDVLPFWAQLNMVPQGQGLNSSRSYKQLKPVSTHNSFRSRFLNR